VIQKYAVATIQGLAFASSQRPSATRPGTMLMAGLSESVQGYPALVNVTDEVKGIRESYPGASLINSDFRVDNVKERLDQMPYPLIHIASHGEFTGNSRNNYILTWDGRMTLDDLDRFIRSSAIRKTPVELLSLSACKTAAGDDRASLGLAGLAVKSGARTAVASLWDIDDKSTSELFVEFYRIIHGRTDINRAEALRQAQLIIKTRYDHPYFWSPFLLIGNWQ
jgi:CHAT domain-containing protein